MKRFVMLYTGSGSYTGACVRALCEKYGTSVLAIDYAVSANAPFKESPLAEVAEVESRGQYKTGAQLAERILKFGPDAVYVSGWSDRVYLNAARRLRAAGVLVISGLDGQYKGSLRQWLASKIAPWYLGRCFDVIWTAGERQAYFAQKLGFSRERCWGNLYCCDWSRFAEAYGDFKRSRQFLFVGRYVEVKGLDVLMQAYSLYRSKVSNPWSLACAGTGPLQALVASASGAEDLGFVQPEDLPKVMASSGALILASNHEPWGVVVQEAAAAGLPLICSDRVGAAVHLLRDYYNGFSFPAGDAVALSERMVTISQRSQQSLDEMSQASHQLSQQFKPELWAETLNGEVDRWHQTRID